MPRKTAHRGRKWISEPMWPGPACRGPEWGGLGCVGRPRCPGSLLGRRFFLPVGLQRRAGKPRPPRSRAPSPSQVPNFPSRPSEGASLGSPPVQISDVKQSEPPGSGRWGLIPALPRGLGVLGAREGGCNLTVRPGPDRRSFLQNCGDQDAANEELRVPRRRVGTGVREAEVGMG